MAKTKPSFRDATEARHAYRRADAPSLPDLAGDWRIEFLGNKTWIEDVLPKAQRLLGINHLFGLRFIGATAWHLVGKKAKHLDAVKPLSIHIGESAVDSGLTATMTTTPGNGRAWELFTTEVRLLDADRLVGVDLVGWERFVVPMPFVLHRHEA